MPPAEWLIATTTKVARPMYAGMRRRETGRTPRRFPWKIPRSARRECPAIPQGIWPMIYVEFSVLFRLGSTAAARTQHRDLGKARPALRAVGVFATDFALVLAGHYVVANPQQRPMRQGCTARQALVVDERTVGGVQVGDAHLVAIDVDAAMRAGNLGPFQQQRSRQRAPDGQRTRQQGHAAHRRFRLQDHQMV